MQLFKNGVPVDEYVPSYGNKKILIAIDSSKSNTAIAVGDEFGNVLDDYEIAGGGKDTDVYDLCAYTRANIKQLFRGSNILKVGIEDIITKKEGNYKGLEVHQSRAKITAVFNNFMFLFEEFFNIRPIPINNWEWKVAVLPEEYRKKSHDKGSKDWFMVLGNRWADRKDDVTDAVCILMYMYQTVEIQHVTEIREVVPSTCAYEIGIIPVSMELPKSAREFAINNSDTLIHNIETIAGILDVGSVGYVTANITDIPIEWVYSDRLKFTNTNKYERVTNSVKLLVERK